MLLVLIQPLLRELKYRQIFEAQYNNHSSTILVDAYESDIES